MHLLLDVHGALVSNLRAACHGGACHGNQAISVTSARRMIPNPAGPGRLRLMTLMGNAASIDLGAEIAAEPLLAVLMGLAIFFGACELHLLRDRLAA